MSRAADFTDKLRDLILEALHTEYSAESCLDSIRTGNHYQSVILGKTQTTGFRTDRNAFLDQIDFRNKKVLDLGSNLGELSRAARNRGAAFVDGFESDRYFLAIANAVNVYNDVARVSFFERDITDPSVYAEHYDIVMAFSVFAYISSVLPNIAAITDGILVLETHKLDGNLEAGYLTPVSKHFPHHIVLGESEWGVPFDRQQVRAVIVFAKEEARLKEALKRNPLTSPSAHMHEASAPAGAAQNENESALPEGSRDNESTTRFIDVRRTCLQKRFFSMFEFDSTDELLTAVARIEVDLESIARSRDLYEHVYSGWVYWLLYLKGYLQYVEKGGVDSDNIYYAYLTRYFAQARHDPGLRQFSDPRRVVERILWRFRDLDVFRGAASRDRSSVDGMSPVRLIVRESPGEEDTLIVYESNSAQPVRARLIDGWHRLFAAKLFGIEEFPCELLREPDQLGQLKGRIEHFRFDGRRLVIHGWFLDAERPIQLAEARVRGRAIARVALIDRPDVKRLYPHIAHAERSGFIIDSPYEAPSEETVFDIVGISDWLPIGLISVPSASGTARSAGSREVSSSPMKSGAPA